MKVTSYGLSKKVSSELASRLGIAYSAVQQPLAPECADAETEAAIITVYSRITAETLDRMPRLKAVIWASTGIDEAGAAECRQRGIEVRNCPTYATNAVAELAIALALAALRDIPSMVEAGKDLRYPSGFAFGSELRGKRCSILGAGRIGSQIARTLIALGCTVTAYSRTRKQELVDAGVRYAGLGDALASELIFIALPDTEATYHLIGDKELGLLKDGSGIINISRGEVIDSTALLAHIGRLAFVVTDVLEGQFPTHPADKATLKAVAELLKKPNFLHTPFVGVCTDEAGERLIRELLAVLAGLGLGKTF
ncbi:hypothetical protein H0O00_00380 [Candidatus Micrarchaeota archaeon]|nr:hypothetical protein [Candidatus Micrarchaeota archaeon]